MLVSAVPQVSLLGPLLSNIHNWYVFETPAYVDLTGYANENTPYVHILFKHRKRARQSTRTIRKMFHWFSTYHMVAISGKCDLLTTFKTLADIHIFNADIFNK